MRALAPRARLRRWYRAFEEEDAHLALRIALGYLAFGVLWVAVSDRVLAGLVHDPGWLGRLQTAKGGAFVAATSVFLFLFTWVSLRARGRLREQRAESERFLGTLISNLPGTAYSCRNDRDWTMTYLSPGVEELTGYEASELLGEGGTAWADLIHPDDRERVWQDVQAALRRKRPFRLEYRIRTRTGETRWMWEQGRGVYDDGGELLKLEGFITDVTERTRARERLRSQMDRLRSLRAIDLAIMGSLDLRITLSVVLDQVTSQLAVDAAAVLVFNHRSQVLEYRAGRGFRTDALRHSRLQLGTGYAGRAALKKEAVHVPDLRAEPGELAWSWLIPEEGFVSYLAVPLVAKGQLRGVLEIFHRAALAPDDEWLEFMEAVAGQAAIAVDNARLFEELEEANLELRVAYEQTIEGWAGALDLRDDVTEGHSRRVTELTLAIAQELGVADEELVHIRRGALLHDIGKLAVPDRILLKSGKLTEEEWAVMRKHPTHARDLLSSVPFLQPALDIPYCHHERWDGTGYPSGLKGEEIPLSARIFAVADVWDALRSDRPYRAAWSEEEALDHIRGRAGVHFDPEVVEAFLRLDPMESVGGPGARAPQVASKTGG